MNISITNSSTRLIALAVGAALVASVAFGSFAAPARAALAENQIQSILSLLQSFGADATTISNVNASLRGLPTSGGSTTPTTGTGGACYSWTRDLQQGSTGADVMALQKFLNGDAATMVASTGAGSPGNETSTFGPATKAAVMKFQTKYGLTPVAGYFGAKSRAQAALVCGGGSTPTPSTGGVTVSAGAQPANALVPANATRVPFTTFTVTNGSGSSVNLNSVTVERTGLAADSVFSGVILVEGGVRVGNTKTLNSNHQATLDAGVTILPGQSKTFTVAGDIGALSSQSGQIASLSVVAVNASGAVAGSLPIAGASHTMNNTLTIGTLTVRQGASDPDSTTLSKEIGTTNYLGASISATAGSAEDVWLKSIRWNQSGSAASSDIANVRTVIDGTDYTMSVDATGKYYSVIFPGNGIKIAKGFSKEIMVKFDIISGANRNANWDIYKAADMYVVGDVYGFGIAADADANTASATTDASEFITSDGTASGTAGTPFFSGSQIDISAGSVTSFSRANEVPAQNIAENTANQPLGGFAMDVKGEGITVQQLVFWLTETGSAADGADITSVTLVDENGAVVAGPDDGEAFGTNGKIVFTDSVTFPTGRHVYTLKGKLGTDFANGDTVQASTTPSSDWSNITGASTGNTVSLSSLSTAVTGNIMTMRSGAVVLSISSTPAAQNVVAGLSGATFGQYIFDATNSGEDVKFTSAKFYYDEVSALSGGAPTNCHIWDGATRLTSSPVNLTVDSSDGDQTFTFDTNLTVTKGTSKTIAVKCDLSGSASAGSFAWDLNTSSGDATFTGTGASSGTTITPTTPSTSVTDGNTMTVATGGALTVSEDSSSPAYKLAAGGTTGVTIGVLRFNGTNEDMRLDRVGLVMSNVAATSTPADITQVTLWDGATQVGTAIFSGSNRYATSSITGTVTIPANSFKNLTVKADLASIGVSTAGESGVLIQVDYDGDSSVSGGGCSTRAYGQSSGSQICSTTSSDTSFDGVRMFRAYPTVAQLSVPSNTLITGTAVDLTRFSVAASNNGLGIGLNEIALNIATSSGSATQGTTTVTNVDIYAYTDSSFSTPVSGFTDGLIDDNSGGIAATDEYEFSSVLQIPAGTTYYFKVVGDVTLTAGSGTFTGNVTTKLLGDAAFPVSVATLMLNETNADSQSADDDFIWSPNSTTTSATTDIDWTNGYGIPGLPSAGLSGTTLSK